MSGDPIVETPTSGASMVTFTLLAPAIRLADELKKSLASGRR